MGLVTVIRSPQFSGLFEINKVPSTPGNWNIFDSSSFTDALKTNLLASGLVITSLRVHNVGSTALLLTWSSDIAILSGKAASEAARIDPGQKATFDLYPYSSRDAPGSTTNLTVVHSTIIGVRPDDAVFDETITGVGTGVNQVWARFEGGFLGANA